MDRRSSRASEISSRNSRTSKRKTSVTNPEARENSKAQPQHSSIIHLENKKRPTASGGSITLMYMKLDGTQEKRPIKTPDSYLTLQQGFAERFPRVKSLLIVEFEDGRTLNPMEVKNIKDGAVIVFREFRTVKLEPTGVSVVKPVFYEEVYLENLHERGAVYEVVGTRRRLSANLDRSSLSKFRPENRRSSTSSNSSNTSKRLSTS